MSGMVKDTTENDDGDPSLRPGKRFDGLHLLTNAMSRIDGELDLCDMNDNVNLHNNHTHRFFSLNICMG